LVRESPRNTNPSLTKIPTQYVMVMFSRILQSVLTAIINANPSQRMIASIVLELLTQNYESEASDPELLKISLA